MTKSRIEKKRYKRKLRKRAYFIIIPLIILLLAAGYGSYLYLKARSVLSEAHTEDNRAKSALRDNEVNPAKDNVSILIIGVDASEKRGENRNALSDTLILATLNKQSKSVKLLSIPRDSLVYIPDLGYETKINSAHSHGGTEATINTVENLLDIPVDYWVKMNFEAFIDLVDAVDGIDIDVPYEFTEQDSRDVAGAIHLQKGFQHLDGEEALALARSRKLDNDIERGKRQQEIIKAIAKKAISPSSILKLDNMIDAVGTNMTTNMTFKEMKSFSSYFFKKGSLSFDSMTLKGSDYKPGKVYYYLLDPQGLSDTKEELKTHLEIK